MKTNARLLWFAVIACLLMVAAGSTEAKTRLSDAEANAIIESLGSSDPLAAADALSTGWRHADAINVLETHADTTQAAVLWRMARSRIDLAELMDDQKLGQPLYELAVEEAEQVLELEPNNPEGHIRIATASGRIALLKGPFSAAGLVKDTYRHAHLAAAEADSMPVAFFILGRTHRTLMEKSGLIRRLAGLSFAAEDSIAHYFKRALLEANGKMIQARVEYADHLIHEKEEKVEARKQLEAALDLPLRDEHDEEAQQKARKLLAEL
jgi:tetratricopeptide (TPR) repeat protein